MKESAEIKALDQLHVKGAARGQSGLSVRGGGYSWREWAEGPRSWSCK